MPNIKEFIKKIGSETVSLEEQQQALSEIEKTIKEVRQKREEEVGKSAKMVVDALKQIEQRLNDKFQDLLATPAMVGAPGKDGKDGKDGKNGLPGPAGINGTPGKDGIDGEDGKDGVSVVDAKIDFDGSLVITLSNGNEIDAGLVIPTAVAEQYNAFMTRGEIIPLQTGNSGKYLTTDGNNLAWTSTGNFTSVAIDAPTTDATFTNDTGITGWVYSNKSVSVGTQDGTPQGVFFRPNGTEMFVVGSANDRIYKYTLGTAWDVSTASFNSQSPAITQDSTPIDLYISSDGLTVMILGNVNDTVYQYSLSVAWDVTTLTYASKSFSVTTQEATPAGMWFRPDGSTMYIVGTSADTVFQYTLSTPWDISTASYANISFSISSQEGSSQQVNLSSDGTKMWVAGNTGDDINEYNLGTAWNISTATFVNNVYIGFQETGLTGLFIDSTAANRVYIVGSTNDTVYQYNTATNTVDVTTDRLFVSGEGYIDGNTFFGSNVVVDGTFGVQGSSAFGTTSVSGTLTATSNLTLSGSTTATGNFGNSITTGNISMGTGQTTGTFIIGATGQTGAITVGQSTGAQTLNLGTGATTNATTKTINIGTAGVSGSTTTINIGSAVSGALGNISMGNSGTQFLVAPTTSAVNYVQVTGSATTVNPTISAQGSDTNIGLTSTSKGTGSLIFRTNNNAQTQFTITHTGSAVNYWQATGAATGSAPVLSVVGSDTNIDLNLTTKGTGVVNLNTGNGTGLRVADLGGTVVAGLGVFAGSSSQNSVYLTTYGSVANGNLVIASKGSQFIALGTNTNNNSNATEQMRVSHTASAVNYVQVTGSATGGRPTISAQGSDTNINTNISTKGSGVIYFNNGSGTSLAAFATGAANYAVITGRAAGVAPTYGVDGSDTNIDLALTPKGTGLVRFGTYTAGAPTATGFISIKAADGTTYKILVGT